MAQFDLEKQALVGAGGLLAVRADDEITRKLAMLIEGECEGLGPSRPPRSSASASNATFNCERPFAEQGAQALRSQKRGPKDPLPTHGGSGPPGDPAPLPRPRRLCRGDCPEASARAAGRSASAACNGSSKSSAFKKKLYQIPAEQADLEDRDPADQDTHSRRALRSAQPGTRRAATPGRQGLRQPRGPVAADPRAPAAGHMGLALRLERSARRAGRAAPGAAIGP